MPIGYRPPVEFSWDYDRGEIIADGVIHAIGVCFSLIGGLIMVVLVAFHSTRITVVAAVFIYAMALVAMLGVSAAYNMWPVSDMKWILRRFDHAAIYLLIAGTYTPFPRRGESMHKDSPILNRLGIRLIQIGREPL